LAGNWLSEIYIDEFSRKVKPAEEKLNLGVMFHFEHISSENFLADTKTGSLVIRGLSKIP